MERAESIAFELETLVGDLSWERILRYFGITHYRLRRSGIIITSCIWHPEKTPSLIFYPEKKGVYGLSCLGCGDGGWRYYFILTAALLKSEFGEVTAPPGREGPDWTWRCDIFSRAHEMYFEQHIENRYGWPTGSTSHRRVQHKLIALVKAIRRADVLPEHVQIEQPHGPRRLGRHARRRKNRQLRTL